MQILMKLYTYGTIYLPTYIHTYIIIFTEQNVKKSNERIRLNPLVV